MTGETTCDMRFLVTGASGFIGKYFAESLAGEGHDVIAVYRNTPPGVINGHLGKIRPRRLDLKESLHGLEPVDVIIHSAAQTQHIDARPADYIASNVITTLNLAEYARATKPKIFVYFSTVSIHGEVQVVEIDEKTPINQPGIYGLTKYLGEATLRDYASDFPSVSIRLPSVVGRDYFKVWLGDVLQRANKNEPISVYSPEFPFNNVVDLMELRRFVSRVIEVGLEGFETVTLGAADPLSVREVVQLVISLTGSKSVVLESPALKQAFTINLDKLKGVFRFEPATTESIIRRYVSDNLVVRQRCIDG